MLGTRQMKGAGDKAAGRNDRVGISRPSPLPYTSPFATVSPLVSPRLRPRARGGLDAS